MKTKLGPMTLSFIDTLLHKREQAWQAKWRDRVEKVREVYGRKGEEADTRIMKGEEHPEDIEIVAVCCGVEKALDDLLSENITDK